MKDVKFHSVNSEDESDYIFIDKNNNKYHIFSDKRGRAIKNINRDFWDNFLFCESIKIEFKSDGGIVTKIISYK